MREYTDRHRRRTPAHPNARGCVRSRDRRAESSPAPRRASNYPQVRIDSRGSSASGGERTHDHLTAVHRERCGKVIDVIENEIQVLQLAAVLQIGCTLAVDRSIQGYVAP